MSENQYHLVSHTGQVYNFGEGGLTIGRQRANQVAISDKSISRQHARILVAAGKCWIRDENSGTGTFVNDQRVQGQQELRPGDVLRIGNTNFRLEFAQAQERSAKNVKSKQVLLIGAGLLVTVIAFMVLGSPRSGTLSPGGSVGGNVGEELEIDGNTEPDDFSPPIVQENQTNSRGMTTFRDPGTNEKVEITVVDEAGQPDTNSNVIYVHGVENEYEVFFAQDEQGRILGAGFFPHNSAHEIKTAPNVMHAINPDQAQAVAGYIGDLGKSSKDYYQSTLTGEEMQGVHNRVEGLVHFTAEAIMHLVLPQKIGVTLLLLQIPGDTIIEHEAEPPPAGKWDNYNSYNAYMGSTETYIYIESQPPVMESIDIVDNSNGIVTMSILAVDPTHYPQRKSYKIDLIDHTIFEGPTAFSDLVYNYRVLESDGTEKTPWIDVSQNSVCVMGNCTEKEIKIQNLPNGNYVIVVYATDEVGNDSEIESKAFSITDSTLEPLRISFEVSQQTIMKGECININWEVVGGGVTSVAINNASFELAGTDQRCPQSTTKYSIEAFGQANEILDNKTISVEVLEATSTYTPKPKPTNTPKPEKATIYLTEPSRCRTGNSKDFPDAWFFEPGTTLEIIGTDGNGWYKIKINDPKTSKTECWIGTGNVRGSVSSIPVVKTPPPQLRNLSNVSVNSREIVISVWDNASIDGDRIRLTLNNTVLLGDFTLTGSPYKIPVTLNAGPNTLIVTALNVGSQPPNTVTVKISNVTSGSSEQTAAGLLAGASQMIITAP